MQSYLNSSGDLNWWKRITESKRCVGDRHYHAARQSIRAGGLSNHGQQEYTNIHGGHQVSLGPLSDEQRNHAELGV